MLVWSGWGNTYTGSEIEKWKIQQAELKSALRNGDSSVNMASYFKN